MSDEFDRGKTLEEIYFASKEREAIEKLRAKMKVAAEAKAAGLSSMKCPRCDGGTLKGSKVENVMIDTCEKCGGLWLDSGELDQLTKRYQGSWFGKLWSSED